MSWAKFERYNQAGTQMGTFLITFKPASENPERGWPLEELQSLVRRLSRGDTVEEK
jgi:hypothetical protein